MRISEAGFVGVALRACAKLCELDGMHSINSGDFQAII
jgi:hypothetical protein